jgi:hypothetical protein
MTIVSRGSKHSCVCVCDRLFFGEDVMRYRNIILVFIAISNPVD